ncbi:Cdc14-like protein phosphatase Clp1/Flp1 [Schizosaccharomyces octosporus yFS286]|uniref:protein-tyrosine-phosphatase n=1 Tax=Schizosaccharomyces octosporus (strain yFS286) TaxID=483514 RepID=S9RGI8_SCHOY|nr:Cdc14-like protein phosphatase Clp1/Flp1 [Schizosaccharomyces octosporus yFS286]EPX73164.1 Cdc14-like protein phosphatase Clp1/Flp1 [Schizosaccharomyces octosporus yFS286]
MEYRDDGLGEMIEFLEDKLYFTSLDEPPNEILYPHMQFFTIDNELAYNPFYHDFGPLNVSHLIRFAVIVHGIMAKHRQAKKNKTIVLYSSTDTRLRANAACLLACYMVLVQNWPPHLALAPLAQAEPPFLGFRDAGYAVSDYYITIQDCVYGLWRARESGILNIRNIDVHEYETYEKVENGDFNWISPKFIAFASPVQAGWNHPSTRPKKLPQPFLIVLNYFKANNIKRVVRLNGPLYDKDTFESVGIRHQEMYFEDGTVPELSLVKEFIDLVEEVEDDGVIAVHCKAGLGRTGCLIGAYLIYKHSFTANEVISYMRIMRPGMVVGPQQHWLHINQVQIRAYYYEKAMAKAIQQALAAEPLATPPRQPLHASNGVALQNQVSTPLPEPTPGQPRKISGHHGMPSPQRLPATSTRLNEKLRSVSKHTSNDENIMNKYSEKPEDHSPNGEDTDTESVGTPTEKISVPRIRRSSSQTTPESIARSPSSSFRSTSSRRSSGRWNGSSSPLNSHTKKATQRSASMSSINSTSNGRITKARSPKSRLFS